MADVVWDADIDLAKVFAKLNQLQNQMTKFQTTGTTAMNKVGTTGNQKFRQLGFALQRFGIGGAAAFGEIFVAAGAAGVAIGAVLITVKALSVAFKALYDIGKKTMEYLIKTGLEAARSYELAEKQFTAVFEGNEKAAGAALEFTKKLSLELGEDVTDIARTFLPHVEDLGQLEQIVEIATSLSRLQPEQGMTGSRIALQDFMSGQTISLQKRFEIPAAELTKIRGIMDDQGIQEGFKALEDYLASIGGDIETMSDSFDVALGRVREAFRQTTAELGEPIMESAKTELNELFAFMAENEDSFKGLFAGVGDLIAGLVEKAGGEIQEFLANLDTQAIYQGFVNVHEILSRVIDIVAGWVEDVDIGGKFESFTSAASDFFTGVHAGFQILADFVALANTPLNFFLDIINAILPGFLTLSNAMRGFKRVMVLVGITFDVINGLVQAFIAGLKGAAYLLEVIKGNMSLADAAALSFADAKAALVEELGQAKELLMSLNEATEDYVDVTDKATAADEAAANALMKRRYVMKAVAEAQAEMKELDAKISEKRLKFAEDAASRLLKIETDNERKKIDIRIDHARRWMDLQGKYNDKLEDLERDFGFKLRDLGTDLTRDEEDIARKQGRKRNDIERDLAKDRQKIEEDHLARLAEIRRKFDFDAQEAIRANDAIAFLRIKRRLAFELNEEEINRDDSLEDAETNAEEKRDTLRVKQLQEIEDAQIANTRKLEDLNQWWTDQHAIAQTWLTREQEELMARREREFADQTTDYERKNEDYIDWWNERHTITEREIAKEVAKYQQLADQVNQLLASIGAAGRPTGRAGRTRAPTGGAGRHPVSTTPTYTTDELRDEVRRLGLLLGYSDAEMDTIISYTTTNIQLQRKMEQFMQRLQGMQGRAEGGPVSAGTPYIVGEPIGGKPNPEIFIPDKDGFIVPLHKIDKVQELLPQLVSAQLNMTTKGEGGAGVDRQPRSSQFARQRTGTNFLPDYARADFVIPKPVYLPPPMGQGGSQNSYDQSRTLNLNQPNIDPDLTDRQIGQVKAMYLRMRLEEEVI